MTDNEFLDLLRMRRLDARNCDEAAKERLMILAADEIQKLRGNLTLAEEGLANYQQEVERLHSTLAYRLQELDNAKWLIRNGEKHFGSLWRDATAEDINAITRRAPPQSAPNSHPGK